jgi:hypothetical protein
MNPTLNNATRADVRHELAAGYGMNIQQFAQLLRASRAGALPYERREPLFSPAERCFLDVLEQVFATEYCHLATCEICLSCR